MRLYYTKRSPYARKVQVVALEKDIPIELIEVDLMDKPAHLLHLNPVGKIPVLELDGGESISDSTVICEYLDSRNDDIHFIPRDEKERIHALNLDSIAKNLMDITVAVFYEKLLHPRDFHAKFIRNKEHAICNTLHYFDQHINELMQVSIASVSLACAIGYIEFRMDHLWPQASCPQLTDWYNAFSQRPSMQETLPAEN